MTTGSKYVKIIEWSDIDNCFIGSCPELFYGGCHAAAPDYRLENPAHTRPRKKEFDVEHLESALEAYADLFITTDQPLINRINRAYELSPENSAVTRVREICVMPIEALSRLHRT
jgi:hypothetical protein